MGPRSCGGVAFAVHVLELQELLVGLLIHAFSSRALRMYLCVYIYIYEYMLQSS